MYNEEIMENDLNEVAGGIFIAGGDCADKGRAFIPPDKGRAFIPSDKGRAFIPPDKEGL